MLQEPKEKSPRMAGPGIHISFGLIGDMLNHVEFPSFDSGDVSDNRIQLRLDLRMEQHSKSWLSQANHIFSRLGIASDFTDYGAPGAISWCRSPSVFLTSSCATCFFEYHHFGSCGTPSVRLPICLPRKRSSNRAVIIQIARLPRLLVPQSVWC
jgi:hypothetical protein